MEPSRPKGLDDVIFIAIDFEYLSNLKKDSTPNFDSRVGIAVLDTKDLISSPPEIIILTDSFIT